MPMLTREGLAHKFRQNWMAKHPSECTTTTAVTTSSQCVVQVDDSLTSLNWLQNLNIMRLATPSPPASPASSSDSMGSGGSGSVSPVLPNPQAIMMANSGEFRVNPNVVLDMSNLVSRGGGLDMMAPPNMVGFDLGPASLSPFSTPNIDSCVDYKTNPYVKPPYSYATLICMAMKESRRQKITLAGIYKWITDNFMYYRIADPSWQNSIRHNLSLNKCFLKVPRRKDEPGKGGFWRINPEYSDMFVNGIFKKRRNSARENVPPNMTSSMTTSPPAKRVRREQDEVADAVQGLLSPLHDVKVEAEAGPFSPHNHLAENGTANEQMFNWGAILHQDIDVGGVKMKTEDLIDDYHHNTTSSQHSSDHSNDNSNDTSIASDSVLHGDSVLHDGSVALSPPASDTASDMGLDDLLNSTDPLDFVNGDALDLTVSGNAIRAPEWWSDCLTRGLLSPTHSGLSTPIAPSPVHDTDCVHPWAEDKCTSDLDDAIASFGLDLQNIFDTEKLSSPFTNS